MRYFRTYLAAVGLCGTFLVIILSISMGIEADLITVDDDVGAGDFIAIQDAINASSDGDTIEIGPGTYNERLTVDGSLTIVGSGASDTILDGNGSDPVVNILSGVVSISDISIRGGPDRTNGVQITRDTTVGTKNIRLSRINFTDMYRGVAVERYRATNDTIGQGGGDISSISIEACEFNNCSGSSIRIEDGYHLTISSNVFFYSKGAVSISDSHYVSITDSQIEKDGGIYCGGSVNVDISDNILRDETTNGISIYECENVLISNNRMKDVWSYIYVRSDTNVTIKGNQLHTGGIRFWEQPMFHSEYSIDRSNTVSGKPVRYMYMLRDRTIKGDEVGQVILAVCTNISIEDTRINDTQYGVQILDCEEISFKNVSLSGKFSSGFHCHRSRDLIFDRITMEGDFSSGIYSFDAKGSLRVTNSKFTYIPEGSIIRHSMPRASWEILPVGIYVREGASVELTNNDLSGLGSGVYLDSIGRVLISGSKLINNTYGIGLEKCGHVKTINIKDSEVLNNTYGIELDQTNARIENNMIRGNTFAGIKLFGQRGFELFNVNHNTITENRLGIYFYRGTGGINSIKNNDIHDNWDHGIMVLTSGDKKINAERNYWGSPDGPTILGVNEAGDRVSTEVDFSPWYDSSVSSDPELIGEEDEDDASIMYLFMSYIVIGVAIFMTIIMIDRTNKSQPPSSEINDSPDRTVHLNETTKKPRKVVRRPTREP